MTWYDSNCILSFVPGCVWPSNLYGFALKSVAWVMPTHRFLAFDCAWFHVLIVVDTAANVRSPLLMRCHAAVSVSGCSWVLVLRCTSHLDVSSPLTGLVLRLFRTCELDELPQILVSFLSKWASYRTWGEHVAQMHRTVCIHEQRARIVADVDTDILGHAVFHYRMYCVGVCVAFHLQSSISRCFAVLPVDCLHMQGSVTCLSMLRITCSYFHILWCTGSRVQVT